MSKTSVFTTITPLPGGITKQAVIETYHNHVEMIDLNPLVIERFNCKPPNYAPAEEFYSTWYTIKGTYISDGVLLREYSAMPEACQNNRLERNFCKFPLKITLV